MKIDREEATRIARLARLEFEPAALDRVASDMTAILGYIDQLRELDLAGGVADEAPAPTPMREDVAGGSLPRDAVASNAPSWDEGFFVVPPVIGGEP